MMIRDPRAVILRVCELVCGVRVRIYRTPNVTLMDVIS